MKRLVVILSLAIAACGNPTRSDSDPRAEMRWASIGKACPADAPAVTLSAARRDSLPEPFAASPDTRWAALAKRVPGGWGGFFLENGVSTIYLVDPAQQEAAIAVLRAEGLPLGSSVRVKQARWDFAQLHDWYRYLTSHVWAVEGVTSGDIQEARNRLEYGVIDEAARERLEQRLTALGVPCFLVAIDIRPPVVAL